MTPLMQLKEQVFNSPSKDWAKKLQEKLKDSPVGAPPMDVVIREYSVDLLFEYNEQYYSRMGQFTPDHRSPGEKEIKHFSEIIAAVLVERQIVSEFDNHKKLLEDIYSMLKEKKDEVLS